MEGFRVRYQPGLDGMRGASILLIMTGHFAAARVFEGGHAVPLGAWIAMDAFFVLSGYLICGLLLEEWDRHGRISLRNFWTRRALRILPAMIAMLAIFTAYLAIQDFPARHPLNLRDGLTADVSILFGYSNWLRALEIQAFPQYPQMWSLSMEMQFYLVWPLVLLAMLRARLSPRTMLVLFAVGIGACALVRALTWTGPASLEPTYHNTLAWTDAWLVGCSVAVLAWSGWRPGPRGATALRVVTAAGVLVTGYLITRAPVGTAGYMYEGLLTLTSAAMGALVLSFLFAPTPVVSQVIASKPIVFVGVISYGLYIWHMAIAWVLNPVNTGLSFWPLFLIRNALAFAIALLSYRFIEQPFLRLKKRFGRGEEDRPAEELSAEAAEAGALGRPREPGGIEG